MIRGIDVSVWQGTIDWDRVKAAGVEFAMIRAGFGENNIDRQFERNAAECNRVGIPCGVYWFSYAVNGEQAALEARYCLDAIRPYKIDYPVCIDFEYESAKNAAKAGATVNKSFVTALVKSFCAEVENAGYKACVYTNLDYSRNMLDMEAIAKYDLWYARYTDSCDRDDVDIWQHSNKGSIDGISGDVDLNICFKEYITKNTETPKETALEDYVKRAADKAVAKGIIKSNENGDLMLQSPVTRQDMIVMLELFGLLD